METMRKEWGSPMGKVQMFTPQEYVAACGIFVPVGNYGNNVWIDVVNGSGYYYTYGPDGTIDEATMESFNNGFAPAGLKSSAWIDSHGHWYEHMTIYKKNTSSSIPSGAQYSNTNYMTPVLTNVAVYIGKKGVISMVYAENSGLKPDDPNLVPTADKTFS